MQDAASLNADGKKRKIVVTGCLAQRYNSQLAQDMPETDMVRFKVSREHKKVNVKGSRS